MLHDNLSRHVLEFFWTRSEPGADFMWILRQMGRVSFAENLVNQFHWSQLPLMEGKIWCSLRHSALPERILKRVHFKLTLGYTSTHSDIVQTNTRIYFHTLGYTSTQAIPDSDRNDPFFAEYLFSAAIDVLKWRSQSWALVYYRRIPRETKIRTRRLCRI